MALSLLFLGILATVVQVQGQQPPTFTVSIVEQSPLLAPVGSTASLSCHITAGLQIILTHDIEWIKLSRVAGLTNESLVITKQQALIAEHESADHFGIDFKITFNSVTAVLSIRNVDVTDDGNYECRVTNRGKSAIDGRQSVDVIVPNDVERIAVKIDNSTVTEASTKVTVGRHLLFCSAEGSNPPANVTVWLDKEPLPLGHVQSNVMRQASRDIGAPRFSVEGDAVLQLTMEDTGKELRVTAGNKTFTTTFIIIERPTVSCTDATARESDTHVRLVCDVEHDDVSIVDFVWELTDTGIVYSSEAPSQNKTVTTEALSEKQTRVTLNLYVVRWGSEPTMFTLTVITDVGDVSGRAYLQIVPDAEPTTEGHTTQSVLLYTTESADDDEGDDDVSAVSTDDVSKGAAFSPLKIVVIIQQLFVSLCLAFAYMK